MQYLAAGEALKELFCHTPGIKDRTFDSSGFSAKGILISASAIPQSTKNGEMNQEKNNVECSGEVEISMIEFVAAGETCRTIF